MNVLLDTCTFLWILSGSKELSETAKNIFLDEGNEIYLSAISSWELSLKYSIGKIKFPQDPSIYIPKQREKHGILPLDLCEEAALHLTRLQELHKDPFDRMLVCQALVGGFVILTPDVQISQYPVRILW